MKISLIAILLIFPALSVSYQGSAEEFTCEDQRKDCSYLRSLGWCKYQQKSMAKFCPMTCLFCKKNKPNGRNGMGAASKPIGTTDKARLTVETETRDTHCVDNYGTTRCKYYKYIGWCEKNRNMKYYCKKTCVCDRKIRQPDCRKSKYGCCWDNKTAKTSQTGTECPGCKDDARFLSLCRRFKSDCQGTGGLGKSLRKYCEKTCELCVP